MAAPATFFRFGTVTDTYYGVIGDTANDPDLDPDLPVVSGTVTFTASLTSPLLFTSAPFAATLLTIQGVYDDLGRLSLNGSPGVRLVATDNPLEGVVGWTWNVAFDVQVNGIPIERPAFSFRLPSDAVVDLTTVQPVATVNGVPTVQGPPGAPGTGVILRGMFTGTDSTVLPTGYGAAQAGWAYRVRSVDGSYDELWVWVWNGTGGSWVDAGPAFGAATIDDSTSSPTTTYSSAQIDALIAQVKSDDQSYVSAQLDAYEPDDYMRLQNADLSWPFRNAPADRHVTWVGTDFPPLGNGYALYGMDSAELVTVLP